MRRIRCAAYGDDIGQHSWVTKQDLEDHIARLAITNVSRVLDLGCGPGGTLAFVVGLTGCNGTGVDMSTPAIKVACHRAASLGLDAKLGFQQADLNQPLPFPEASFEAAMSLDVVLHLRDRTTLFREIRRVLIPGGRFLFTDAGVVTGLVSADEIRMRANRRFVQFVPFEANQRALQRAGLQLLEVTDGTTGLLHTANGRLKARLAHERELKDMEGATNFEREQQYLGVVVELSQRRALSRMIYLARNGTT